jgi:magnesium transporter
MLYEFSDVLRLIGPEQWSESHLAAGLVPLDALKGDFGARIGFHAGLVEECEKADERFRSAVESADGHIFALVSVQDIALDNGARDRFGLFVKKNLMLLVSLQDDDASIPLALEETARQINFKTASLERMISMFFERLLINDGRGLENFDDRIAQMEAKIENNETGKSFNGEILAFRRRLLLVRNSYEQLMDVFDAMLENESDLFSAKNLNHFRTARDKVARLSANAQQLRDSLVQVREAYMAALDYNANRIMKVFTVVTTVFLPLMLIVGWYGMNFKYMPELASRYGYPAVIVLSVAVVILSFVFFKRKRFF